MPLLLGDPQFALCLGNLDARQGHERRTGGHFVAEPGVSAHHQRLDARRDQRDAIGVVDHLTRRLKHLAQAHGSQDFDTKSGRSLLFGRHRQRCIGLIAMLIGGIAVFVRGGRRGRGVRRPGQFRCLL